MIGVMPRPTCRSDGTRTVPGSRGQQRVRARDPRYRRPTRSAYRNLPMSAPWPSRDRKLLRGRGCAGAGGERAHGGLWIRHRPARGAVRLGCPGRASPAGGFELEPHGAHWGAPTAMPFQGRRRQGMRRPVRSNSGCSSPVRRPTVTTSRPPMAPTRAGCAADEVLSLLKPHAP